MKFVEPIRKLDTILDVAEYLRIRNERDYVLFMFGIYTGLRISDILSFRVRDVKNKKYIYIIEKKTKKDKRFPIQRELELILESYVKNKKDYEYLFKSRTGANAPIKRDRAYFILREAGKAFGIESIGTHTLRKTFGYFLYQQTKDIYLVKEILNHSDIAITRRYIGLTQDTKDMAMKQLSFKRK